MKAEPNSSKISRGISKGNKGYNSFIKHMHKKGLEHSKASGRQCLGEHTAKVLIFTGPWDTSFKISTAVSVQESAEGDSTAEQGG